MNYTWYVKTNNKIVGTVIAEDELSALFFAQDKFNFTFEDEPVRVEQKSRRRKKK